MDPGLLNQPSTTCTFVIQAYFLKKPSDFGQGLRAICCDSEGRWYMVERSHSVQGVHFGAITNISHKYSTPSRCFLKTQSESRLPAERKLFGAAGAKDLFRRPRTHEGDSPIYVQTLTHTHATTMAYMTGSLARILLARILLILLIRTVSHSHASHW